MPAVLSADIDSAMAVTCHDEWAVIFAAPQFRIPSLPSIGAVRGQIEIQLRNLCIHLHPKSSTHVYTFIAARFFLICPYFIPYHRPTTAVSARTPITPFLPPVSSVWSGHNHSIMSVSFVGSVLCHTNAWRHQTTFDDDSFKIFAFAVVRAGWLGAGWTKGEYGKYPTGWRALQQGRGGRGAQLFWFSASRMNYDGGALTGRHSNY